MDSKPKRLSPVRRELLQDLYAFRVDRNIAAGGEIANDAAHHLARTADARRDIALREPFGDDALSVVLDCVLLHETNEPSVDVLQREVAYFRRERPHAGDQLLQHVAGEKRIRGE